VPSAAQVATDRTSQRGCASARVGRIRVTGYESKGRINKRIRIALHSV
jgi:hypothetical protein